MKKKMKKSSERVSTAATVLKRESVCLSDAQRTSMLHPPSTIQCPATPIWDCLLPTVQRPVHCIHRPATLSCPTPYILYPAPNTQYPSYHSLLLSKLPRQLGPCRWSRRQLRNDKSRSKNEGRGEEKGSFSGAGRLVKVLKSRPGVVYQHQHHGPFHVFCCGCVTCY